MKGNVTITEIDQDSVSMLGKTYYTESYVKEMMIREYARGKRDGLQTHVAETIISPCPKCGHQIER